MALENSGMNQTCKDNGDFNIVDGILVEYLGNDSFVVIPDGVTKINDHVFLKHYVTSVSIPVSVKKISKHAFEYTIMHIYYAGTREQWNNVRKSIYLGGVCERMLCIVLTAMWSFLILTSGTMCWNTTMVRLIHLLFQRM